MSDEQPPNPDLTNGGAGASADPPPGPDLGGRGIRWTRMLLSGVRTGSKVVVVPVVVTGALALVLGLAAWRLEQPAVAIVLLASMAAIGVPSYAAVRLGRVTRALDDPRAVANQAGDLLNQARTSPDITRLWRGASRRSHRQAPRRGGKVIGGFRTVHGALDAVQPDRQRHDRLAQLTPEQLRRLWFLILMSLWAWVAAAAVTVGAALTLLLRWV